MENRETSEVNTVNEIFRYNLKLLRATTELSGEQLAEKLGMSKKRILDLEIGRMPPNMEDLVSIVDYFPITFDDLLEQKLQLTIPSNYRNGAA